MSRTLSTAACLALAAWLPASGALAADALAEPRPAVSPVRVPALVPAASAGPDAVVVVGQEVEFIGLGFSPDDEIVEYVWDFESDGIPDFTAAGTGIATHVFTSPGDYRCLLTVMDSRGRTARDSRRLIVVAEAVDAETAVRLLNPPRAYGVRSADGVTRRYAIMINGGAETRFWTDVTLAYDMLVNGYGFAPSDIYLLNYNGADPEGGNPAAMIDGPAQLQVVEAAFDSVAARSDADDEVFLWITDHGRGYSGPLSQGGRYVGYLDGRASVDPGDEADFRESDFKLRALTTGGDYYATCNHGLNVWMCYKSYASPTRTRYWRQKFVSRLESVYVEGAGGAVSDNDVYIERLTDYAAGDGDRDGYIDTSLGEVFDYDGDGVPPYDPDTGVFDEGDWGAIDAWTDDFNFLNTGVPENGYPYRIFDADFEGRLCVDLGYTGGALQVDGRDDDNAGLFDWMDVDQDGDIADTVSVDEVVCLYSDGLYDDDLASWLGRLPVAKVTVVAEQCFSGGLVEDLTSPARVICTATIEDAVSWGNAFIRGFVAALHGLDENGMAVDADTDGDDRVSMLEAFNYAAGVDYSDEIPQYDDNGDGVSHTDPVPAGGDGVLGAATYLAAPGAGRVATPVFTPGGGSYDSIVPVTILCVTPPAAIHYTTDGSEPTPSSPRYAVPLQLNHRVLLRARAYAPGMLPSACAQAAYFLPGTMTVHVRPDGDDQSDGLTWGTAKRTISEALRAVGPGGDVWVRGETGQPYHERVTVPLDVALYGGFAGGETRLSQRAAFPRPPDDPDLSILDGDQSGTVVTLPTGATPITLLDGFTVRNGRAAAAGGISADSGSPTLRNCVVTANTATDCGGGIACRGMAGPRIERCVIAGNAAGQGGGLDASNSSASIVDCTIANNNASFFGGGLYCCSNSFGESSRPQLVNCAITNNAAGQDGGGLYFQQCAPVVVNATLYANSSGHSGGGVCCLRSTLGVSNSILWGDYTNYYGDELRLAQSSSVTIDYSDLSAGALGVSVEVGSAMTWGDGWIEADPSFVDADGPDGDLATWWDNDLGLAGGSACVDAGNNAAVPPGILRDLLGHPRFADDLDVTPDPGRGDPPIVDMGACEREGAVVGVAQGPPASDAPALLGSWPNPLTAAAVIRYWLPRPCPVMLGIYDVEGRLIRTLVSAPERAGGTHAAVWDARGRSGAVVGPGVYLCRLEAGGRVVTRKLTVLR